MNTKSRIIKLEDYARRRPKPSNEGRKRLGDILDNLFERIETEESTIEWCAAQSPATIVATCRGELRTGKHSIPVWARCRDLQQVDGPVGKLATALVTLRLECLKDAGLDIDAAFTVPQGDISA